jgi:glycosyltransferase involved in cell wall biosynthesis
MERGIEAEKLRILPRGLDTDLFRPERRNEKFWERFSRNTNNVRLLYVGRVSKEKDLDVLATAYRQLRDSGVPVELFIVGDGPYAKTLGEILPDAVFTGYLAGADLATAYASADVFVFPSTTDTFGNVIIEAQASGLPVVVSDIGGPKELVEDGVSGFVTKALDAAEFAGAIEKIATDAPLRARMAQAARESVAHRSWPNAFQRFWAATAG